MEKSDLARAFTRAGDAAKLAPVRVERRSERLLAPDVPTFMEAEQVDLTADFERRDAIFLGVPFEGPIVKDPRTFFPQGTAPQPGTDLYARQGAWGAPHAVRQASEYYSLDHSNGFMPEKHLVLGDLVRIADAGDIGTARQSAEEALEATSLAVEAVARSGAVPFVIGGDHLVPYFVIAGIYAATGKRVGVISYDSHLDLSWHPRHWAGSQWARAMEIGALDPHNLVEIGIRGLRNSVFWKQATEELGVSYFTAADVDEIGLREINQRAVERALNDVDLLYISIDVDVFDPASLGSQKYPEPGGLTGREVIRSIGSIIDQALEAGASLAGFDFCELAPQYESDCYGPALAARCFVEALGCIATTK